jgi:hypothetical protein
MEEKNPYTSLFQEMNTENSVKKERSYNQELLRTVRSREQLIAGRNLQMLPFGLNMIMHGRVKIKGSDRGSSLEFLQRREERNYQIDRTIPYLSKA